MQNIQTHLSYITNTLADLASTPVESLNDAKSLKQLVLVIDRVVFAVTKELSSITQIKLAALSKLAERVDAVKPVLAQAEKKFMIEHIDTGTAPARNVQVDIGNGIHHSAALYRDTSDIPALSYGAVMKRSAPHLFYNYGAGRIVSITACQVIDFTGSSDNFHTICCGNTRECEYGNSCKYFHDPAIWPDSTHVQKFIRTSMVKKCPYFGHAESFRDQQLSFENLRTLARYCAYMALLISQVE